MKSTFKAALIIAGIALFGVLFVACGSEDAEEPAQTGTCPPRSTGTRS